MNAEKTLRVSILGKSYTIVTDEPEADVYAAVTLLDQSLQRKIAGASPSGLAFEKAGIIAALELACESVRLKRMLARYENKCNDFVELLTSGGLE